jgi:hypothetical protein
LVLSYGTSRLECCGITITAKNDSGTNGILDQLVYVEGDVGQQMNNPLGIGSLLADVETGVLRYYHHSQNNARFFNVPHLIRTEEDLERFLEELSRHDTLEYIRVVLTHTLEILGSHLSVLQVLVVIRFGWNF